MKSELRNFFRVPVTVPIFVRAVELRPGETPHAALRDDVFEPSMRKRLTQTINISGAGLYFTHAKPFEQKETLEVRTMLEPVHYGLVILYGHVMRIEPLADGYGIAMKFIGLDERPLEVITRFVLERERQLIKEKRVGWL